MIFAIDTILIEEMHTHRYKNLPNGDQEEMMKYVVTYKTPVLKRKKRHEFFGMGSLLVWLRKQEYRNLRHNGRVDAAKWSKLEMLLKKEK